MEVNQKLIPMASHLWCELRENQNAKLWSPPEAVNLIFYGGPGNSFVLSKLYLLEKEYFTMPQDRESGARANKYGRETSREIASQIGAKSISTTSNEFVLDNRKITIRCARYPTQDVGASYKMLKRIDAVIAALEQVDGNYELYEISPTMFEKNMRATRSKGASAGKVGLVKKSFFINDGKFVCKVKL